MLDSNGSIQITHLNIKRKIPTDEGIEQSNKTLALINWCLSNAIQDTSHDYVSQRKMVTNKTLNWHSNSDIQGQF